MTVSQGATWIIALLATAGVIVRPWRLPEATWAVLGAGALVAFSLLPWEEALHGIGKGTDVYLFLVGMMLLSELARSEGLFDWLAAVAVGWANGSGERLFALIYAVGIVVTVFLSNDATAVVLTPAVYAATKAAKAEPLPYLLICAFIANAASFVLPISNPANFVVYGSRLPPLASWLAQFALPSVLSIAATFAALWLTQRVAVRQPIARHVPLPRLSPAARVAACGIGATALALLAASTLALQLGLATFIAGMVTLAIVLLFKREAPWNIVRHVAWGVLPLVAGMFVLVEGLQRTGVIEQLSELLRAAAARSLVPAAWAAGGIAAIACNLLNNLPAGLIAGSTASAVHAPPQMTGALLVGIDLGPNLSVTGSLATILWLAALRREGVHISAGTFLRTGVIIMPPALLLALATVVLFH
jgi:arsenical pump membrane protein